MCADFSFSSCKKWTCTGSVLPFDLGMRNAISRICGLSSLRWCTSQVEEASPSSFPCRTWFCSNASRKNAELCPSLDRAQTRTFSAIKCSMISILSSWRHPADEMLVKRASDFVARAAYVLRLDSRAWVILGFLLGLKQFLHLLPSPRTWQSVGKVWPPCGHWSGPAVASAEVSVARQRLRNARTQGRLSDSFAQVIRGQRQNGAHGRGHRGR